MGGYVNVAIRLKDGRTYCQERWTNNTPECLKDPKVFAGDTDYLLGYIDMTKGNTKDELGVPSRVQNSSYGLIVIDCVTNTIIDNNDYTTLNDVDPIFAGGRNRRDHFVTFAKLGMISLRRRSFKNKDEEPVVLEIRKLSPEEALAEGEAQFKNALGKPNFEDYADFLIDTGSMTYIKLERDDWASFKAKLQEIGFPMTKKAGLNKHLSYVDGRLTRSG